MKFCLHHKHRIAKKLHAAKSAPEYASENKKLRCCREATRCFVSLNIALSHPWSLEVIEIGTIRKIAYKFPLALLSNYDPIFIVFEIKLDNGRKSRFSCLHSTSKLGVPVGILP